MYSGQCKLLEYILHVSNMSAISSTKTMLCKEGYIPNKKSVGHIIHLYETVC